MNFDKFDRKMRVYETSSDFCVPPEVFMVARLDGRSFTRLTKERHQFDTPFDERFRELMLATGRGLMTCGFRVLYAYIQSDEISLLLDPQERQFSRKLRKYDSIMAGEASARFSLLLGDTATFDCRISQLPNSDLVVDYFRWRNEDAGRNALNAWCYWTLRKTGLDKQAAHDRLRGLTTSWKTKLLMELGINFQSLPAWQKRGMGLTWESVKRLSSNPLTGQPVYSERWQIKSHFELPVGEQYSQFILERINSRALKSS